MTFQLFSSHGKTLFERDLLLPAYKVELSQRLVAPANYIASAALSNAVNVALALGQPLLVTGEPGTGKTQLAAAVAYQLGLPLLRFNTKTTSTARDVLYHYDSLRHFHDAQLKKEGDLSIDSYIGLQALGRAIAQSDEVRSVVLIDEIDKAPRDFPNDLLDVLEDMCFELKETSRLVSLAAPSNRPIVVMTSNSEKHLPDAFLRRCVYYHISFPDKEQLISIVNERLELGSSFTDNMKSAAIDYFLQVRQLPGLYKKPATAELLSWIHVLDKLKVDFSDLDSLQMNKRLQETLVVLAKNQEDLGRLQ
jgi:MoxR-like ATPase